MDRKTWISSIAEAKALSEYLKDEWEVYTQTSGKGPFDLVAFKGGELRRVEVKATETRNKSSKSFVVQLRSIRSNRTGNYIKKLDPLNYDELVVYVEPLDELFFFTPEEVAGRTAIFIHPDRLEGIRKKPGMCPGGEEAALKAVGS